MEVVCFGLIFVVLFFLVCLVLIVFENLMLVINLFISIKRNGLWDFCGDCWVDFICGLELFMGFFWINKGLYWWLVFFFFIFVKGGVENIFFDGSDD